MVYIGIIVFSIIALFLSVAAVVLYFVKRSTYRYFDSVAVFSLLMASIFIWINGFSFTENWVCIFYVVAVLCVCLINFVRFGGWLFTERKTKKSSSSSSKSSSKKK